MQLTNLPVEILLIIIRQLDIQSLANMYNTCQMFRTIVCMHGGIKKWDMSLNTMATTKTLKLNFFKDIAEHLLELNLRGVPDLYKTTILPAIKRLKSLKKLDISYTNLTIMDFLEIHQLCPTIDDISVNFGFGKPGLVKVSQKTLLECQSVFECIKNVHFVGSIINLLYSQLALHFLQKAKLCSLKFTIAVSDDIVYIGDGNTENVPLPVYDKLAIYLLNWKARETYYGCRPNQIPVLAKLEFGKHEFIIIIMLNLTNYTVYASPIFRFFFNEHFHIDVEYTNEIRHPMRGNVGIWVWNKETTNFDVNFFHILSKQMKTYFPSSFNPSSEVSVPKLFDWFYTIPQEPDVTHNDDSNEYEPKRKRRNGASNLVLNYDRVFKEKHKVQLSLLFDTRIRNAITLTPNCDYLRKLTFLSLTGSVIYSSEFFNILFRCCDNLDTLNVDSPSISPCASSISRSVPLSRSLKNIRLVEKRIDFRTLFSSFSQCRTLENIRIIQENFSEPSDLGDPSIVLEKCDKLYCLYIQAPMSETSRVQKLRLLNKAKERCMKYALHIVINARLTANPWDVYMYDPFIDVFCLNPIKPY